ncbi:MAG: glycoside hydrolase family 88 protein [Rhodocyclaceae bacterium]
MPYPRNSRRLITSAFSTLFLFASSQALSATVGQSVADYMVTQWSDLSSTSCGTKCFSLTYSSVPATPNPKGWEYTNGVALGAMWKLYEKTGDVKYYNYVKKFVDKYVSSSGSVPTSTNQDGIQPAILLPGLYDKTKDARYLTAMTKVRASIDALKKNSGGAFWHKSNYPDQQWLDGLYMTEPFLATYAAKYANTVKSGDATVAFNIVTKQFKVAYERLFDASKKLPYHAWNGASDGVWAGLQPGSGKMPPKNGQVVSPILWSRAIGWYFAGLIDVLEHLPSNHADRAQLVSIANTLAQGLAAQQDASTGLWYQVTDVRNTALPANGGYSGESVAAQQNWLETSASALFAYGLAKGARLGILSSASKTVATKAWTGIKSKVVISGSTVTVKGGVAGMGVGGTYNAYVNADFRTDLSSGALPAPKDKCSSLPTGFTSVPLACKYIYVRDNVPQAVGAVMLASSELEF